MQNPPRLGGLITPGVQVGHHVVSQAFLMAGGGREVDAFQAAFQLPNLAGGDLEADATLRLRQRQPEPTPG